MTLSKTTGGLRFSCQRGCINCCDQAGYVYLTEDDVKRAAQFTGMEAAAFEKKYIYRTRHQRRFRKPRAKQCPFLEAGGCSIHPAKPTQCRTFPFWPELVENRAAWNNTARFCPGIGKGPLIQIGAAMEIAEQQRRGYPEMYK
ncbi:MAG TPA: YkgJ family cysteine cluster protein [Bryobacteraceae bacterium]|nr:YkgJ family cysteine cluster protein [Bryobacteraceae bacterium]